MTATTEELWQQYDEQGRPLKGQGCTREDAYARSLLHGAAHVWIWREQDGQRQVLVQQRAAAKRVWPNRYDISAAGHIALGETPLRAAQRETEEEIGLRIAARQLTLIGTHRMHLAAGEGIIENEFQWIYLFQQPGEILFSLQASELALVRWIPLEELQRECQTSRYAPHGPSYYALVTGAISTAAAQ